MVLSQLRQHERAGDEDFMVMRTSCAAHGRRMHTNDHCRSHGANLCMQVMAFVNLQTECGQYHVCRTLVRDVLFTSAQLAPRGAMRMTRLCDGG